MRSYQKVSQLDLLRIVIFFNWEAYVDVPKDSLYEGGTFHLKIEYCSKYPIYLPKMYIATKIFHPNLNYGIGQICCCALDYWAISKI